MNHTCKYINFRKVVFLTFAIATLGCTNNLVINENICDTVNVYAAQEERKFLNDIKKINISIASTTEEEELEQLWCNKSKAIENYLSYLDSIKECTEFRIEEDLDTTIADLNDQLNIAISNSGNNCK